MEKPSSGFEQRSSLSWRAFFKAHLTAIWTVDALLVSCCSRVTNYYKFSGLKPHQCIMGQFWGPEIWNQFHWAKSWVWAGFIPCGSSGRGLFLCQVPASKGCPPSLAHGPFLHLQVSTGMTLTFHCRLSSDSDPFGSVPWRLFEAYILVSPK